MPDYTYQCMQCQAQRSVQHGMAESPTVVCQACGGIAKKRITTAPTVLGQNIQNSSIKENDPAVDTAPISCEQSACTLHHHRHS